MGLLFVIMQLTTLLGPTVLVAYIANDQQLSFVGQLRVAFHEVVHHMAGHIDYASGDITVQWWFTFGTMFALLILGVLAAVRAGAAYSTFVIVFLLATIVHQLVAWQIGFGFLWHLEAWVTLIILGTMWRLGLAAARRSKKNFGDSLLN